MSQKHFGLSWTGYLLTIVWLLCHFKSRWSAYLLNILILSFMYLTANYSQTGCSFDDNLANFRLNINTWLTVWTCASKLQLSIWIFSSKLPSSGFHFAYGQHHSAHPYPQKLKKFFAAVHFSIKFLLFFHLLTCGQVFFFRVPKTTTTKRKPERKSGATHQHWLSPSNYLFTKEAKQLYFAFFA